jgi:transcriptional regulator with XRE-family HTH domain
MPWCLVMKLTVSPTRTDRRAALRTVLRAGRERSDSCTQRELADYLGLTQPHLALMETGQRRITIFEFIDISDALSGDRLALFKELLRLTPRRFQPITRTKEWKAQGRRVRVNGNSLGGRKQRSTAR